MKVNYSINNARPNWGYEPLGGTIFDYLFIIL